MKLSQSLKIAALGSALMALPSFAEDEIVLDIPTSIDIQGKKVMWLNTDDEKGDNFEEWYGQANMSVIAKSKTFEGKMTLKAYPSDFGYKNITQRTAYDTVTVYKGLVGGVPTWGDTTKSRTEYDTSKVDKFELYEAYVFFKNPNAFDFKMGRFISNDRVAESSFGNYADEAPGVQFMPGGSAMNAIEISRTWYGNVFFRAALVSTAPNLNSGDLRMSLKLSKLASLEWLNIGINYRNDLFKVIKETDSTVQHYASATVEMPLPKKIRLWGEAGMRGFNKNGDTPDFPITGGLEVPGGKVFDKILLEAEWLNDRPAVAGEKSKDVLGSFFVQKKVGERFLISFGFQSNNNTEDYAMIGRFTGTIN